MAILKPQPKPFRPNWFSAILTNLAFISLIGGLFYCKHPLLGFISISVYLLILAEGSRKLAEIKAASESEALKRAAENAS
jgi:hypothetical protein